MELHYKGCIAIYNLFTEDFYKCLIVQIIRLHFI